jgi:membrane protein
MGSMWRRGGLGWWQLVARVWREIHEQQLPGRCAELAYYFLFSAFPLLLFLTTLLGYLAGSGATLRAVLFHYVSKFAPSQDVTRLLNDTLDQVIRGRGGAKLSLSLLVAVWVASNGMLAIARTLNSAYALAETRPWWLRRLVAIGLTIGFAGLIACALVVILYGREIGEALADQFGIAPVFVATWHFARWPLVMAFVLVSFEAIYNFAPNLGRGAHRSWGTPGAVIGVGLWLAVSFGFRFYLGEVRGYSATYGSLGAVIVLLLWFYLTALAIVVGGAVNSVISRQDPAWRRTGGGAAAAAAAGGAAGQRAPRPRRARSRTRRR